MLRRHSLARKRLRDRGLRACASRGPSFSSPWQKPNRTAYSRGSVDSASYRFLPRGVRQLAPAVASHCANRSGDLFYSTEKKKRVRWKKIGAAKQTESRRSSIPPWPSIRLPQSFTPRSRLIADITSPPRKPMIVINRDIAAACHTLNGVSHHRPAPSAVAVRTPPTKPSTVFDGDTTGAIL